MNQTRNIAIGLIAIGLLASLLYVLDNSALGKKSDNVKEAENDRNDDKSVDTKHDTITSEKQNADGSTTVEITKVDANSPDDANPIVTKDQNIPMIKDKNGNMQIDTEKTDDCFKCNAGVPDKPKAPDGADNPKVITYEDGSQSWESVDKNGFRLIYDEKDGWITLNEKVSDNTKSDSSSKSSSSSKSNSKDSEDPTSKYMIIFQDGQYAVFLILDVDNEVITKMRPVAQFEHSSDAKKFIEIMESVS